MFSHITDRARARGMVVNEAKTALLCITDNVSTKSHAFMRAGSEKIRSSRTLKCLGFTFAGDPTPNVHVRQLIARVRSRTWSIRKLKRAGFNSEELLKFYKSNIRSVAEYAAPAYHSMIPEYLADELERQQTLSLKNIFGVGKSAALMREEAKISTLKDRREAATLTFAKKTEKNPHFAWWFEKRKGRITRRRYRPIIEANARTNRHRDSPINYMKRLLNDQYEAAEKEEGSLEA